MTLTDARATARSRTLLRRLFPLYIHDLSPHTGFYVLDDRGRWRPDLWRDWLANPHVEPWLIDSDGQPAGFAIVAHQPFPYMSPDRRHKLCEFFILSARRRMGLGQEAAGRVFDLHAGPWELTVLRSNSAALGFWRATIGAYTAQRYQEVQLPGDIMFRFDVPPRGPG
jgi:predicted acetyltransferase